MGKKINCLVTNNDLLDTEILDLLKLEMGNVDICVICETENEGITTIKVNEFEIVFCDARTPLYNCKDLSEKLYGYPIFIFIKSPFELIPEIFGLNVLAVIEKPVTLDTLLQVTAKAIDNLEFRRTVFPINKRIDDLAFSLNNYQPIKKDYFYFKEDSDIKRIENKDVLYLESMGNFSYIHTLAEKKHMTLVNLKHIEDQLPLDQFIRVHRRYVINLAHIKSISSDGNINLYKDHIIPLGNIYKADLMKIINSNLLMRH